MGSGQERTVPFRDSANLATHVVTLKPFSSLPGTHKMCQQRQSGHNRFGLASNKAGEVSGSQTMKGLVSHLMELGFHLEGRGGEGVLTSRGTV